MIYNIWKLYIYIYIYLYIINMKYVCEIFWWELMQATAMPSFKEKGFWYMHQREVSPNFWAQARSMATRFWSTMSVMVQSFPCHEDKAFFKKPAHIPPWSIGRSSEYHSLSFIFLHSFIEICQEYGTGSIGDECQTARLNEALEHRHGEAFCKEKNSTGTRFCDSTKPLQWEIEPEKNGIGLEVSTGLCSWQQSVKGSAVENISWIIDIRWCHSWYVIISLTAAAIYHRHLIEHDRTKMEGWPKRCQCAILLTWILQRLKENKFK